MVKEEVIKSYAKKYGTPFYLFDYDALLSRVQKIKEMLPSNSRLCYAMKANPFLLDALKDDSQLLFEVCSPGELSICEAVKVNPDQIVFSGVVKTKQDIERAYNLGVGTITLESFLHATFLEQVVKSSANPHPQGIIVRLTNGCQFGMNEECVRKSIALLKDLPGIKIQGIHFFTGTQKKMKKVAEEVAFIQGFCSELQKEFGIAFERIEYGPGLAFDYFSPEDYAQNFDDLKEFSAMIKDSPFFWVVESGRYVASSCGTYVSSVMDLKQNAEVPALFIDGGINHVNYYGQIMGMKKPPIHLVKTNSSQSIQGISTGNGYTIYGSLCTTADIITKEYPFESQPGVGDLLSFANIGAYSVTEGIYLFLSHPLP
ncbi:MAG: alanine racemase, partial [Treponema sp.]|nr:alanine racemase [Treponema sp.]